MDYSKLIENIKTLATKKGISKTAALVESGVGKDFTYGIERGITPSVEKIQKLAAYFNVSTDFLLGNTDEPTKNDTPYTARQLRLLDAVKGMSDEQLDAVSELIEKIIKARD